MITALTPSRAVGGARVTLDGSGFPSGDRVSVTIGDRPALVAFASAERIVVVVPADLEAGLQPVRIEGLAGETAYLTVGTAWATGLHQVDNPVFDSDGNLFVTYSGSRSQETPVSVFRVTPAGSREPFASGIVNATSLAIGPDGALYVSSRFEGTVYRVAADGSHTQFATDLGVACGLAFDAAGAMYVGDRAGTIFRVRDGKAMPFATLPPSVAAFHLAMGPDGDLFVSAPTLGSYDYVYRIDPLGAVQALPVSFGRPQGLAVDHDGVLHVVEALAGASGLYRVNAGGTSADLVVGGVSLVGVAFGPGGSAVVVSGDTAYRFD